MRFRNSVQVTIDNFASVFRLFLYRMISGAVFFSLIYVILRYGLSTVLESAELETLKSLVNEFPGALFSGNTERLQSFQTEFHDALRDLWLLIGRNSGSVIGSVIGVCLMYLLLRFVNGLALYAVAGIANDRMSVFTRTHFSDAYIRSLGKALLFQLLYVPLTFLYDALSLLACWFFFFYIPSFLPVGGILAVLIALSLTIAAIVLLQAFKMTIVSDWQPALIAGGKGVGEGFRRCFRRKKGTARRFGAYLVAIYLIVAVNVVFGFVTFGSALLLTVPLSYLFLISMQLVNYYEAKHRRYFVADGKIAGADPEDVVATGKIAQAAMQAAAEAGLTAEPHEEDAPAQARETENGAPEGAQENKGVDYEVSGTVRDLET